MRTKYDESFKKQLVGLYFKGRNARRIYERYKISKRTFYEWINEYRIIFIEDGTLITAHEYKQLCSENEKIKNQLMLIQSVGCTPYATEEEKLEAIKKLSGKFPLKKICEWLQIDRGKYYRYISHVETQNELRDRELAPKVKKIFEEHNARYGAKRICAVLQREGHVISVKKVSKLMREQNLITQIGKKSDDRIHIPYDKRYPNLLTIKKRFALQRPDVAWLSDITEYHIKREKVYLCVIEDIATRYVLAFNVSLKPDTALLVGTFEEAYKKRGKPSGLIFHSDQGSIYTSTEFQEYLKANKIRQSFSRKGSPHDNAHMESFFASLKKEELYRKTYTSYDELHASITEYISYYNNNRLHSCLGYRTPKEAMEAFINDGKNNDKTSKNVTKT